jgi:hypothetical protein
VRIKVTIVKEKKKPPETPPDEDQPKPPVEEPPTEDPPVEEPPPRNHRNEKAFGLVKPKERISPFYSRNVVLRFGLVTTDFLSPQTRIEPCRIPHG